MILIRGNQHATAFESSSRQGNSDTILNHFSDWTQKVHPIAGREALLQRLEALLSTERQENMVEVEEFSVFNGRIDVSRSYGIAKI